MLVDPDSDAYDEIEAAIQVAQQEMANEQQVAGNSYLGDMHWLDIERDYPEVTDPGDVVVISSSGYHTWAVDSDLLVPPHWRARLNVPKSDPVCTWNDCLDVNGESVVRVLRRWLKKRGYEEVDQYSGASFGDEQEVWMEHVLDRAARDGSFKRAYVDDVWEQMGGGETSHISGDRGFTEAWIRTKPPASMQPRRRTMQRRTQPKKRNPAATIRKYLRGS